MKKDALSKIHVPNPAILEIVLNIGRGIGEIM